MIRGIDDESRGKSKNVTQLIVSMRTRAIARGGVVQGDFADHAADGEYEYRDVEYEYEADTTMRSEQIGCSGAEQAVRVCCKPTHPPLNLGRSALSSLA